MKTILLISPYWREKHRWMVSSYKLAELWQRLGYRVIVVCMGVGEGALRPGSGQAPGTKEVISDTLTIYRKKDLFLPDPLNFGIAFGFAGLVRRVIKDEKPDLIICNKLLFWTSFSVIALWMTGHKVLVLTDALVGITWWPRAWWPKVLAFVEAWTIGWAVMLCASKLVTFFPQPEGLLRRMGVWGKTRVIPTGIDLKDFGIRKGDFGKKEVTVTYVGRLESVKGADDFLAAVTPLKKDYPNLKIQSVGWYKDGHPLVTQYEKDVIFTGLRDDIPAILAETDIFVMPSYSEGLSNAIMEAMASGCACVVTGVGGNMFLVQNGISGFLFTPGDRAELRSHVRKLIDDPAKRKRMGEMARKRIEEQFSWDVVGNLYTDLFKELMHD